MQAHSDLTAPHINEFQTAQAKLAQFIRQPDAENLPESWSQERVQVYADLFYNNIEDFLARFFPVLKEITPELKWHAMVRDFIQHHQSNTPYFLEIGQEFLAYLETERVEPSDPAFMLELAHYEWVELALDISEDEIPTQGFNPEGDLLAGAIFLSPLVCSLAYQYPVHKISAEFQPQDPPEQATFLVVYRDQEDEVRFMEINAVTARLFELIEQSPLLSGKQLLLQIAEEINHPHPHLVLEHGAESLTHLKQSGIILGTRLTLIE